jgi:Flp pilus assembly pilin Flp
MTLGYIKIKSFIADFRKDERAMEIVQVVLLVLVGLLLILALWGALSGWLQAMWERVTGGFTDSGGGFVPDDL